jgi:hypothetical protein
MSKRKAISKKTRFEVFKRDAFVCQYCGSHPPMAVLHVDHIVPVAGGGDNDIDNLVTACDACNLGKGARQLSDIPPSLSSRAAEVAEREAQLKGYTEIMMAQRERSEEEAWDVATLFIDHFGDDGIRKDWLQSIRVFIDKLAVVSVLDAMEIAIAKMPFSKNTCFRYFCGICWSRVRGDS